MAKELKEWKCEVGFYVYPNIKAVSREAAKRKLSKRIFKGPRGRWITCKKVR